MSFLRNRRVLKNLLIMMCLWLSFSVNFWLMNFLVNNFDNVYPSALASSLSDFLAEILGAYLYYLLGARMSFAGGYVLSCIGGIIILAYGLQHQDNFSFTFLILFAKFGISSNGNLVYVAHPDTFPAAFAATAFGFCQVFARVFTVLSPVIA